MLKAELKNIGRTLDEMKAAAAERERMIRGILEQTQCTRLRVDALESHRNVVCRANTADLERLKIFKWKLLGGIGAVSYLSGLLGQESLRLILGQLTG